MFSQTVEYALRAVVHLASNAPNPLQEVIDEPSESIPLCEFPPKRLIDLAAR